DGRYLAVGALEEKFWRLLCETLGRPDLVPFGRDSGSEGARTRDALGAILRTAPLAAWTARFAGVDCCVTPVNTLEEALVDPQFAARGMVRQHPSGMPGYAPPFRLSEHVPDLTAPAPAQGEHTLDVLREVGYAQDTIDTLIAAGAVRAAA